MEPVKIYGCSDDLVEIENSVFNENEIDCYNHDVRIKFDDGTVIRIGYSKPGIGVWWIRVEEQGKANHTLTICEDEDSEIYSDIFQIESEVFSAAVIPKNVEE